MFRTLLVEGQTMELLCPRGCVLLSSSVPKQHTSSNSTAIYDYAHIHNLLTCASHLIPHLHQYLQDLLSQLPTPHLLLQDFSAWHHHWGNVIWMKMKEVGY
jgi:hypothetical protein